ncbi:MAG: hypothetical protein PHX01_06415, partial [Clostridia bacterium]|nr:hypothetical protein [Clostridia bacterium]
MKRKRLSCIALLLLMFFALGIVAEGVALAAPIGEWKFDEGSGTTAYDSSGKGKTGTITGATYVDGLLNKALKFAGSTNYVKVPQSLDGLSNWSFTAYIKPTGTGEVKIYSEKDDKNNFYLYISITADDRIKVGTWHGKRPGWDIYQTPANQIKRNEWSHLCVTLENGGVTAGSGTVKCYVNRILVEPTGHLGSCQGAVPVTGVSLNKTSTTLLGGE